MGGVTAAIIIGTAAAAATTSVAQKRAKKKAAAAAAQRQAAQRAEQQRQAAIAAQMKPARTPGQGVPQETTEPVASKRRAYGGGVTQRSRTVYTDVLGLSTAERSSVTAKTLTGQ